MKWESLYIYCHNIQYQELLILELEPVLEKMTDKWFFIKYWRGGPHIRLRFWDSRTEIKREIEEKICDFFKKNSVSDLNRDEYYKHVSFDGENPDEKTLPWYKSGTYFYEDYIPETERYGEGKLLEISESIFNYSSKMAVSIFKSINGINNRIVVSSYIMYHFLKYNNGLTSQFLKSYQNYWKTMVSTEPKVKNEVMRNVFENIESEKIKFGFLDEQLDNIYKEFDSIRELTNEMGLLYVLSSQCHMMNNRISVTPEFEYIISKQMGDWISEKMENNRR
ncbi:MAG: lantibiotic dehydratase C-terminal domain-containing protein [Coprococcus sp.]